MLLALEKEAMILRRNFGLAGLLLLCSALASLAGCGWGGTPITADPTISPPSGRYSTPQTVVLSDSTPGASILYTTDGSIPATAPNSSTSLYTTPVGVSTSLTFRSIAVTGGYAPSAVISAMYDFGPLNPGPPAAPPTFNPPAGSYPVAQTVGLADATPNATIYYTTDGTTPTTASTPYFLPFPITATATVEAIATAPKFSQSPVATATYSIAIPPSNRGMWTWMGGSQLANQPPVYGTLGVADPANTPGDNSQGIAFPGPKGTFLLFAGEESGSFDSFSALWQYDPGSGLWTWVAGPNTVDSDGDYGTEGVASAANAPPHRYAAPSWSDSSGNLYFFGGRQDVKSAAFAPPLAFDDLWTLNPSNFTFTWIGGTPIADSSGSYGTIGVPSPANFPSARYSTTACSDHQGNLWMFGWGAPTLGGPVTYNDLWEFNTTTGNWTWETGSQFPNPLGVYGVLGSAAPANTPGGRGSMACWTAPDGKLWFFGGLGEANGVTKTGSSYNNNDLWTFDPATLLWTWVGGSDTVDQPSNYGNLGQPTASTYPGARHGQSYWTGKNGDLWLFGGFAMNAYYSYPQVADDLWRYNIASGQWTWMTGQPAGSSLGLPVYGTLGVPSPANTPGSRTYGVTWVDSEGNLWLFGGAGYDSTGTVGYLSDLWRYTP
jgi:N-acetylneuraminic acid mutarotase